MIVGCVKEIKIKEGRVGLTPGGADALIKSGHSVLIEKDAGVKSGFTDEDYKKAGAKTGVSAEAVYKTAEMIIKVKEPQESEFKFYRPGLILYTYLHLAAEEKVTRMLIENKVTGVAYETVELKDNSLPLLTPMSEVAGRMAVQVGAWYLQKPNGGKGKLLGGVPGVMSGKVVILGTGVVGINAAKMAIGLGAKVVIFGRNLDRLRYLDDIFGHKLQTVCSDPLLIKEESSNADLIISGVLVTGAKAPKLITREILNQMEKGSVLVDVAIDQGGSFESSKPTSHECPVYEENGIIHYCVTNMPGAVPQTSTRALTNATLPYALALANKGLKKAIEEDDALKKGINTYKGKITYKAVSEAFDLPCTSIEKLI